MSESWRWDPCVSHYGLEADTFLRGYFACDNKKVLLVAGAGFDPRADKSSEVLSATPHITGLFIREERIRPDTQLVALAEKNLASMCGLIPKHSVEIIHIFAQDLAVVGGRTAVNCVKKNSELSNFTDIVVDVSALSVGIAFPIIRYLYDFQSRRGANLNLHVVVVDAPLLDQSIQSESSDRAELVHGFRGTLGLEESVSAVKLWVPQLVRDRHYVLDKLYAAISPDEICPIFPFPANNPRYADDLLDMYSEQLESTWGVDGRSIVFADERNPLDLYRSILRIDDARRSVFEQAGGSLIVLSPAGSKALSIGILMAAIERDFPVMYVESNSYTLSTGAGNSLNSSHGGRLLHLWLGGDVYQRSNK